MLRTSLLVLILANLVFYLWSHGTLRALGLGPHAVGEPQRLQQQLDPARLTLLPTPATVPGSSPATASLPSSLRTSTPASTSAASSASKPAAPASAAPAASRPASAPTPAPTAAASAAGAHTTVCLQLGPYTSAQASVGAALRAAGLAPVARQSPLPPQWMVLMGPFNDAAALHRKLAELSTLKLRAGSYAPVVDRPRWEPGVSLGVFRTRAAAEQELAKVRARGVTSAHVVQRNLGLDGSYWRLADLDAAAAARLRGLDATALGHRTPQPCEP